MKKKNQLKVSRRTVMKGALAAGAVMSATSIPSQLFAGQYDIPEPLKPLPTTGGNMRWIDSGDMKGVFWKKIFPEYAASRGITIEYDGLPWKEINKIVPLAVRNGTVHDVFQIPLNDLLLILQIELHYQRFLQYLHQLKVYCNFSKYIEPQQECLDVVVTFLLKGQSLCLKLKLF